MTLSTKPSAPIDITVTGTERTNSSGCSRGTSIPNRKSPHSRVATIEYSPMVAMATVIGSSTTGSGTGAATSSSSVPCQRSRCTTLLPEVLTDDQTPRTLAPMPAYNRLSSSPLSPYMRNAMVAKNSGHRMPRIPSNAERASILRWNHHPTPSTRSTSFRPHALPTSST